MGSGSRYRSEPFFFEAGDPERAMGLLGSRTVFSAMGSGFPWG